MRLINVTDNINGQTGPQKVAEKPVELATLDEGDIGRGVVYTAPHGEHSFGYIKRWNDAYVFVRFHSGDTAAACNAEALRFTVPA